LLCGSLLCATILVTASLPRRETKQAKFISAHRTCPKSVIVQSLMKPDVQLSLQVITSAILPDRSAASLAWILLGELFD
jgi:hypothetical protein